MFCITKDPTSEYLVLLRIINPFMLSGPLYLSLWTGLFPFEGVSDSLLVLPCIIEILVSAISIDPDQTPR